MTKDNIPATVLPTSDKPIASMTALEAVHRLNALHQAAAIFCDMVQAQALEAMWVIRKEFNDEDEFVAFIEDRTHIAGSKALNMVATWDAGRKNREIRELAQSKPSEAMKFVASFTEGDSFSADDEEVARLLSMSPAKRNKEIKRLQQVDDDSKAGRSPADREAIKTLEAENDALKSELDSKNKIANLKETPQVRLSDRAKRFEELLATLRKEVAAANADFESGDYGKLDEEFILPVQEALQSLGGQTQMLFESLMVSFSQHVGQVD